VDLQHKDNVEKTLHESGECYSTLQVLVEYGLESRTSRNDTSVLKEQATPQ
jgi:hypothetical protein